LNGGLWAEETDSSAFWSSMHNIAKGYIIDIYKGKTLYTGSFAAYLLLKKKGGKV